MPGEILVDEHEHEDEDVLIMPGGLCGFGMGFASLMSTISVGGMRSSARRGRWITSR